MPSLPRILLISLHKQPFFDECYEPLLNSLKAAADVQLAEDLPTALSLLSHLPTPSGILITDEALVRSENRAIWKTVLDVVRRGATAVVMGHFPCFVRPDSIKPFFAQAGLPWTAGAYHRTILALDRDLVGAAASDKLPREYSQKAVFIKNVAPGDMWYKTNDNSVVQSLVFAPTSAHNPDETAVALARVGEGALGYIGDVNAEEESHVVVLVMCGLL
ncbi:hypothetical protein K4F52_005220 [Lecanicillium sp. MT-2017a]|nr:hypothetical protein K4F52_005220 [Lecanicillium sp. MT-2017a]